MGAQPADPLAPGFDPLAETDEQPVHRVELAPFLLSKYEVTQGQWLRWTGGNPADYAPGGTVGAANLADRHAAGHGGATLWTYSDWLDDGHTVHAPAGIFAPNPFGLMDMRANVWEWVRDGESSYTLPAAPGDGLRAELADPQLETARAVARGGGFFNPPQALRSSERYLMRPTQATRSYGLRLASGLQ